MEKNKKTILSGIGACLMAFLVLVCVACSQSGDTPIVEGANEQVENLNQSTNNSDESNIQNDYEDGNQDNDTEDEKLEFSVPFIENVRAEGKYNLKLFLDNAEIDKVDVIVKNETFFIDVNKLIEHKLIDIEKTGDSFVIDSEYAKIEIFEDKRIITYKVSENKDKGADKGKDNAPIEDEIVGFIVVDGKHYLNEMFIRSNIYNYINDKGIMFFNDENVINTSVDINNVIFDFESKDSIELSDEDFQRLISALNNQDINFTVTGFGPVNPDANLSLIKEIFVNGLMNKDNLSYSKKLDNNYVIIFNKNVAAGFMNVILDSISFNEIYTNIRLVINIDDSGNIIDITGDSYYIFDNKDIYYFINME